MLLHPCDSKPPIKQACIRVLPLVSKSDTVVKAEQPKAVVGINGNESTVLAYPVTEVVIGRLAVLVASSMGIDLHGEVVTCLGTSRSPNPKLQAENTCMYEHDR